MSKNTTRKGLAFGAGIALVASGFAGVPANAVGVDNGYVSLAPTSGTEYDQLQSLTLDLTGSFTNTAASGGSLKYLVTDADSVFKVDVDINAADTADAAVVAYTGGTVTTAAIAAGVVTLTTTTAHGLVAGDRITVSGVTVDTGADDVNTVQTISAVNVANQTVSFAVTTATAITKNAAAIAVANTAELGNATRAEIAAADLGSRSILGTTAVVSARSASGSFVVDTKDTASSGVDNVLRLVSTAAADTSATATVTAWIDNNDDGDIDATEYQSPTRTVRFLKNADVTFTTAWDTATLGGTAQIAHVTIAGVNISQIPNGTVAVDFSRDGTPTGADTAANYVLADAALVANDAEAVVAGVYAAQADYGSANRGAIAYKTVAAAATDVSSVATPAAANSASVNGGAVKTGTTALAISSQVKYWSTYGAGVQDQTNVPAGVPAVVTVTKTTLAAGSTVTAGGKTLASTGTSISFDTTTNALGKVAFDLAATGTKGTVVTVVVKVEDENTAVDDGVVSSGTTGGYKTSGTLTLTWGDATVASTDLSTALGFGGEMGIAKGSTNTLSYDIRDNFGASSAVAGTYRVSLATGAVTGGASWTGTAVVSGGKASYTFTDNTVTATGVYTVTATLQKLNVAGTAYDDVNSTTTIIRVGSAAAASVTTTTASTVAIAIDPEDFVTQDFRLDANTDSFPYTAAGFQVTGVVKSSTGAPVAGAAVTVSAAGVAFAAPQSTDFTTYTDANVTIGSAMVYTNAAGQYSVTAWSHTAGTNTFTVTSGAATATTSKVWAFATTADEDTTITITAPTSIAAAAVAKGSVTLKDKWGNIIKGAINITFAQTGPGYVVSTPTVVSATTGSVDFVLLTGVNDSGSVVISVTHGAGTAAVTDDVTVTKTIVIGTAGNVGALASWTKNLNDGTVKMYAKNIVGAGKVQFMLNGEEIAWVRATSAADSKLRTANGASYLVRTVDLVEGQKNVLEIYVDGVRTARSAYSY